MKPPPASPAAGISGRARGSGIPKIPATKEHLMGGTTRDGSGAAHQVSTLVRNQTFDQIRKVPSSLRFIGLRELMERGK